MKLRARGKAILLLLLLLLLLKRMRELKAIERVCSDHVPHDTHRICANSSLQVSNDAADTGVIVQRGHLAID